jgi:hypothetical protein
VWFVTRGPGALVAAGVAFFACTVVIVGTLKYFPGVNPAFFLFPAVIGFTTLVWKLSKTWEREDQEPSSS